MKRSIVLFRQDLRVHDNPALEKASDGFILPVYIQDESIAPRPIGKNSQSWLQQALIDLNQNLNQTLHYQEGSTIERLQTLCKEHSITHVYWNRCYEPHLIKHDTELKKRLTDEGISVESQNASLLWEPWTVLNQQQKPYLVFTPFYKKGCLHAKPPRKPIEPSTLRFIKTSTPFPFSHSNQLSTWDISESGAKKRLTEFLEEGLVGYKTLRDFPAKPNTSRLSPYLHFGMISPHTIWHTVTSLRNIVPDRDIDHFLSELGWREFSYYQLYHHPTLPTQNWQKKFDSFSWENNPEHLDAWKNGQTGIPIVDAAMRELKQTGYMHNRMRMVAASFLIKNLLTDWRIGEQWFWEHLYDADLAANSASWQWVAGSGFDAAPYFRIFNPILQGLKFDPDGSYVKRYCPELSAIQSAKIHSPWEIPEAQRQALGIELGVTYPNPIVDLKSTRDEALRRFKALGDQI